jgi:hypothetical protein
MAKTVQTRDIDDDAYAGLVRRAAQEGITVPELMRREPGPLAARTSVTQGSRGSVDGPPPAVSTAPWRSMLCGRGQPGMIGSVTADGCAPSCRMAWAAMFVAEFCPNGAPVLGFGANCG